ncbi:MAG: hypothetical protein JWO30_1279 [Fibrobacteres bacterium]|nr:hypothetical protein [Fibrobacterota bacterium]
MGPPNLASVVATGKTRQGPFSVGEAGADLAQGYVLEGTENSSDPTHMGYHSYNFSAGVGLIGDYVFAAPYLSDQTLIYPGILAGVKYDRVYLAFYASYLPDAGNLKDHQNWGCQTGVRVTDWVTVVADRQQMVFYNYASKAGLIFSPTDHLAVWAYRVTPAIRLGAYGTLNPSVFYVPEKRRLGGGLALGWFVL